MKAFLLTAPRKLTLADVPMPQIGPEDVLVKLRMLGICGTDVSTYRGSLIRKENVILGHEFCGEVAAVGEKVFTCKVGDYVASEASYGCGKCEYCRSRRPSYCKNPCMLGRTVDGALCEYIAVNQKMVYLLDESLSPVEGQGLVGVSTAIHAVQRAGIRIGQRVLLVGPGYGGLQILQLCKMLGCYVTMVGTRAYRLQIAQDLGADEIINIREQPNWEEELGLYDVCIEAAGTLSSLQSCVRKVEKGGTILVFGTSKDIITDIPQKDLYYKEISIVGSKGGFGCYEQAQALLNAHKIKIEPIVNHVFPFEKAPEAFDMMDRRLDNVIRAAISFE